MLSQAGNTVECRVLSGKFSESSSGNVFISCGNPNSRNLVLSRFIRRDQFGV